MQIVALVPGGIGDQILFFPTLDDLQRHYPDAQIDIVVEPQSKNAYRVCKSVQNVIPFDFEDRNGLADWANLVGKIRDREYDVAISLEQSWFIGLFLWLTGIPVRISYSGSANIFFTNSVPLKTEQYAAVMYHNLLQGLGINSPCSDLAISVPKPDIDWAESEQKRLGIQETGYVLLHGGSSGSGAKGIDVYPVENWKQIIQDFLSRQPDLPVVIIQEPDDELVRELQPCPNVKVTCPSDIGKLAAMIAGANLMLCTDSTPLHLAVAVQTYTIALFGATEPRKSLPPSDRFIGIKSPTTKIGDISPQAVLEKIWGA